MRTLGPGSISSFLKIILDVTWFLLWGLIGSLALAGVVMLLLSFNTDLIAKIEIKTDIGTTDHIGATLTAGLFGGALYASGWLLIVGQLRRIFKTLTVGTWIYTTAAALMLPGLQSISAGFSPTTWFSVMVVFVLAEVFREGARLRNEAELTI